jgi:hypothetical protein
LAEPPLEAQRIRLRQHAEAQDGAQPSLSPDHQAAGKLSAVPDPE